MIELTEKAKEEISELLKVEIISGKDVAKMLHTTLPKIKAGILNGTLPIGFVGDIGGNDRVIIVKSRLLAWLQAEDLIKK